MKPFGISYWGDVNPFTGYGNAMQGNLMALRTLGFTEEHIRVLGGVGTDIRDAYNDPLLKPYLGYNDDRVEAEVHIVHMNLLRAGSYHSKVSAKGNVLVTAWETDRLPTKTKADTAYGKWDVQDALPIWDQIWVPSEDQRQLILDLVPDAVVYAIPHALTLPPADGKRVEGTTTFYYIGSWDERKGVQDLVRAYFSTGWTVNDPVELLIHTPPWPGNSAADHTRRVHDDIKVLRKQIGDEVPRFRVSTTKRPLWEISKMHQQSDVFVTASRAEGFCIPIIDAFAAGNMAIASDALLERFRDFDEVTFPVECDKRPVAALPQYLGYELDHQWHEPRLADLVEAFKDAHEVQLCNKRPYPVVTETAVLSLEECARSRFSAQAVGRCMEEPLERLAAKIELS